MNAERVDLHVHSTASDGSLSPTELVKKALSRGVTLLAIADHDSVNGVPEARQAANGTRLTVVPAVEFSSITDGIDIHLLGYFVEVGDKKLTELLAGMREVRHQRARQMVERLAEEGMGVDFARIVDITGGAGIGRTHIARALVEAGYADSIGDAFLRFLGRQQPFYIAKESLESVDIIRAIHDAGGLAVVAHPGVSLADPALPELIAAGLDGIEAYHAEHSLADRERYHHMAQGIGLVCTGGTDYHGPEAPNPDIGSVDVPSECVERFLRAGAARGHGISPTSC